jgi:hypothetical protein
MRAMTPISLFLLALVSRVPAADEAPPAPAAPVPQADDLSITLHARDAIVHGTKLHFERTPEKNTLGFWTLEQDWVSWDFELKKPGTFVVVAMQGSPGGSELDLAVGGQTLHWTVADTGSYHTFTFKELGRVTLPAAGPQTLTLKPTKKVGGAVMDLRQIILLPVLK